MADKADKTMKPVDVAIVGFGWTGAIMAKELTAAGLTVVALERGNYRDTYPDGAYPKTIDELTYLQRWKLFQNMSKSSFTFRHRVGDTALPYRQIGAFKPGEGVGGAGLHWSGQQWRALPEELRIRSHYEERYGKRFIPDDMTIQDWGVTYEELEPHYDFVEKMMGTSGRAYRVRGQIVGDGNPFEADRASDYPLPPQADHYTAHLFKLAAAQVGLHPFSEPSANTSMPYTNPYGCQMGPCTFCGYCSGYACYNYSKASPNVNILPALRQEPRFELRSRCFVTRIDLDDTKRRATGVIYVDENGNTVRQPANIVIASTFAYNNARLFLLSGIGTPYDPVAGKGVVGRNIAYQTMSTVQMFFDAGKNTNMFIGAGGNGVAVDDYNGDHFDHGPAHFVGGAPVWCNPAGAKPISGIPTPHGTPRWGLEWKHAVKANYLNFASFDVHGTNMVYRDVYVDLDPTYRDHFGLPLLRFTFDWKDNDIRMSRYITDRMLDVARAMNPKSINVSVKNFGDRFDLRPYQTTHWAGGVAMGMDRETSVLNRYLQSWDVPNVFAVGSGVFPVGLGYNPTGTACALAYWCAKAIREQYLANPRALV
ncbi:GMC family oxidoreductase [Paraburkholderia kururiensis]|uniref:GMC family oxidoreductase n=1 Tax=Paraburkholderia kururiensis TaxID=984307 RepID=A0ABZ0WTF4_9BURK|nr:GMC family oxidoreductase [Paraburkholderia kururiensis]WQD80526.1 GMC family oxidoreductase [Paraburkholderia kururiensis]